MMQRTLTIGGSITVRLTSCLTALDSTKQVPKADANSTFTKQPNSTEINRRSQLHSDTSPLVIVLCIIVCLTYYNFIR